MSISLAPKIRTDLTDALKAGEPLRLSVLRMLLSEMNYRQIDLGRELADADVASVISREAKKRREAIESYRQGGRPEQAQQEQEELEILQQYMPAQMTEAEIGAEIDKILAGLATREFGQVMRTTAPIFKGRADGTVVARLVREKLEI